MASDPKAELRQLIAEKIDQKMRTERLDDHFDGQDYADAVIELFTVDEDFQSIDTSRLREPDGSAMWQRRLVASTDWQPTPEPKPTTVASYDNEYVMAALRANGIDPATVLAQPGPDIDVIARTITVHHLPPPGTGATPWRHTYPMTITPEGWGP